MFDRIHAFRTLVHNPEATRADLATFAFLAFGVPDREGCHPSEATIARGSRQDRKTVRAALRHLAELGAVGVERQRAGNRVIGTLYSFPMGEAAPRRPAAMEEAPPRHGGADAPPAAVPMGEPAPRIESPDSNRTGPDGVIDLEAVQLARRAQQASAGPWRLENARRAVFGAIERAGIEAVRVAVAEVCGAGLRAYEIAQRLEALRRPAQGAHAAAAEPAPSSDAPALPTAVVGRALTVMAGADVGTKLRWHRAACEAGATARMHELAAWVPRIASAFLEVECRWDWLRLTA
jgi:hypothetical protein